MFQPTTPSFNLNSQKISKTQLFYPQQGSKNMNILRRWLLEGQRTWTAWNGYGATVIWKGEQEKTPRAVLTAPQKVQVGEDIKIHWKGPGQTGHYVTIVPRNTPAGTYMQYFDAMETEGTGTLRAPLPPGAYQIRYNDHATATTLFTLDLQVEAVTPGTYTLLAPSSVVAGTTVSIRWQGPQGSGHYITIVPRNAPDGEYGNYAYTKSGNPVELQAPMEIGAYEIRYMSETQGNQVLARLPIQVIPAR